MATTMRQATTELYDRPGTCQFYCNVQAGSHDATAVATLTSTVCVCSEVTPDGGLLGDYVGHGYTTIDMAVFGTDHRQSVYGTSQKHRSEGVR